MCQVVKKHLESRMLGNLHVRFGVGAGVELPGLHHYEFLTRPACFKKRMAVWDNALPPLLGANQKRVV